MIRMISCSITPARRRRQQDALHHPQRMSKAAEPPWATLLPATSDTPAVALYHDSEYVRSMVEIPCALEYRYLHVLIWITRLPLRPMEALVRVESCDAFEVRIGNVRMQRMPQQAYGQTPMQPGMMQELSAKCRCSKE